ncbi:chain length determinant protein tyrosine kinase EpsG [Uliginosibacterium sp. H3]|uniref:Chain length determinant protein tyrosine kinase EpsG n=1 Tax=Uliginosibacterium silvisoli TaxID=3114758 RepID=A0ABU6K7I3_9RHOO|nr:chain length determinant protein tyrosine kinase EpsG [Uliginosibacterium sp. H3]
MNAPYEAPNRNHQASRPIGGILVDAGRLHPVDAERIMKLQREKNMRFGDAALSLKLLNADDIDFALAQQFDYAYLPQVSTGGSALPKALVAAWKPQSKVVEDLRALRSQLMLRWFGTAGNNALAIVSPEARAGRSWLTANLAVVFSQLGERTLLIDADMRKPSQHELFGLKNGIGLSALLAERCDFRCIQRVPDLRALSVLTAGATPPNPQELLGRPGFAHLLEAASESYDVILIDTPAALASADAQIISAHARGAVIVARRNVGAVKQLQQTTENLRQFGVQMVGSLFNKY